MPGIHVVVYKALNFAEMNTYMYLLGKSEDKTGE